MSCETFRRFEWFGQFFSQKHSTIQGRVQKTAQTASLWLTNLIEGLFPEMDGFCWIISVPGGVLIKPLSCSLETKLYNQWIKNRFPWGKQGRERRKNGTDALRCRKLPTMAWNSKLVFESFGDFSLGLLQAQLLAEVSNSWGSNSLLLETAQRPGTGASDAFIPPLPVLPSSAPSLDLAVEFGQGAAAVGWPRVPKAPGAAGFLCPFPLHALAAAPAGNSGLVCITNPPALPWDGKSSCTQSWCQCSPFCGVFCVSPVGASSGSAWVGHPN